MSNNDIASPRVASLLEVRDISPADRKKIIGRGTLSIVCEVDADTVKVYTLDDFKYEWLIRQFDGKISWLDKIELGPNPRFPDVNRNMTIFTMPKLYPVSAKNKKALKDLLADVAKWQTARHESNERSPTAKYQSAYNSLFNDEHKFWKLLTYILDRGSEDIVLDIHKHNIMEDSNGEVVIVDPLVSKTLLSYIRRQIIKNSIKREMAYRNVASLDIAIITTPRGFTTYRYGGQKGILFETRGVEPSSVRNKGILHIKPATKEGWSLVRVDKESRTHVIATRTLNRVLRSCKLYIPASEAATPGRKSSPHMVSAHAALVAAGKPMTVTKKNTIYNIIAAWASLHIGIKAVGSRLQLATAYMGHRTEIIVEGNTYSDAYLTEIGLGMIVLRKLFGNSVMRLFNRDVALMLATAIRKPRTELPADLRKLMIYHDRKWAFDGSRYRAIKPK